MRDNLCHHFLMTQLEGATIPFSTKSLRSVPLYAPSTALLAAACTVWYNQRGLVTQALDAMEVRHTPTPTAKRPVKGP